MGIFERFTDVLRSYLADEKDATRRPAHDPDVEAAYQELNDYLKGDSASEQERFDRTFQNQQTRASPRGQPNPQYPPREPPMPESIKRDFAELGLPPGASPEACKGAYKKLLKIHHPDRHAGHPENMRKATEKSARLNTAFDRIERWRLTGKPE